MDSFPLQIFNLQVNCQAALIKQRYYNRKSQYETSPFKLTIGICEKSQTKQNCIRISNSNFPSPLFLRFVPNPTQHCTYFNVLFRSLQSISLNDLLLNSLNLFIDNPICTGDSNDPANRLPHE